MKTYYSTLYIFAKEGFILAFNNLKFARLPKAYVLKIVKNIQTMEMLAKNYDDAFSNPEKTPVDEYSGVGGSSALSR